MTDAAISNADACTAAAIIRDMADITQAIPAPAAVIITASTAAAAVAERNGSL